MKVSDVSMIKYANRPYPSPSFKITSLNMTVDSSGIVEYEVKSEWKAKVSKTEINDMKKSSL